MPLPTGRCSATIPPMSTLGIILALGGLVWLAVRLTRRQISLSTLTDSLPLDRRGLVAVDQATGRVLDASSELAAVEASWHPVRFPQGWESLSAGYPTERAFFDRTLGGRREWCEKRCRGAWRVERPDSASPTFWFADRRDATDFTLQCYPFKCT